jgi:membrane protein implicated in regulation of membrane protease activity
MIIRKQRGLTLIGFIIVLAFGLLIAYTGMRVVPMYLEYHALVNALETLQKTPGAKDMDPGRIRNNITNSLWVSYSSNNIKREHIRISRSDGVKVRVAYEVRKPWVGNLDIVGKFERSVTLR